MHELSIAQSIVTLAGEAAPGRRIRRITIEIGVMSGVLPDALSFSFELVAEGTNAQGATLHIIEIPAWARCDDCGQEFSAADPPGACSCGSYRKTLMRGAELAVRSLELEPELV